MKKYIVFVFINGCCHGGWSDVLKESGSKNVLSFDTIDEAEKFLSSLLSYLGLRVSMKYQIVDVTTGQIAQATY